MVCGLVASILILIVEMVLFIVRAVQMEDTFENKKPESAKSQAQYRPQLAAQSTTSLEEFPKELPLMNDEDDDDEGWTSSDLFSKKKLE
jgi:hypothetical protein